MTGGLFLLSCTSGPQDVPEPGMVMALATLGLTGLLAKRKKAN